jgi:beta-galactosidase
VLADALGVVGGPVVDGGVDGGTARFPSVRAPGRAEVRVGFLQRLDGPGRPVLREVGGDGVCGLDLRAGAGRALLLTAGYPCHLDFWRDTVERLGVTPRVGHDAAVPGLVATTTVDDAGRRLLHLVNVAPVAVSVRLTVAGVPYLDGRRLAVPARTGMMLPHGIPLGGGVLAGSSCELAGLADGTAVLRPTQPGGDVISLIASGPVTASRGAVAVAGDQVTVTVDGPEPVRVTLR